MRSLVFVLALTVSGAFGEDWPQWRGVGRDGVSGETGLLKAWPEGGPPKLWTADGIGQGFASAALAGGTIYTTGVVGDQEHVFALDLDGEAKWSYKLGAGWTGSFAGSRCTPTIRDGCVYAISGRGMLACLTTDGRRKWAVDLMERFGAKVPRYGYAECPLIVGEKLLCSPCGQKGTFAAIHKDTGETIWRSAAVAEGTGFCSPILVERGGRKLMVTILKRRVVGVDVADGKVLWQHPFTSKYGNHPVSPVHRDGMVYVVCGYGRGGEMLKLSADGSSVEKLWAAPRPDPRHGGSVLVGEHLYSTSDMKPGGGKWLCVEWKTGKVIYEAKGVGKGSACSADGMLYCFSETGVVGLVPATPSGHELVGRFEVPRPKAAPPAEGAARGDGGSRRRAVTLLAAHPVVSGGRLYIRHGEKLSAFDVKAR